MLMAIELEWSADKIIKNMDPERYAALQSRIGSLPVDQKDYNAYDHAKLLVDEFEVQMLLNEKISFNVRRIKGMYSPPGYPPSWGPVGNIGQAPVVHQVSVANVGLLDVTDVDYHEDLCTDRLREYLKVGWRILAVCPPNDARRPTYILGWMGKNGERP